MRIREVLSTVIFLVCIIGVPVRSEAGDKACYSPGGYSGYGIMDHYTAHRGFFVSSPNRFGRRYLRHYYFAYPYQEKSPYEDLVIRPAGELQITVSPAHAQVFVDGYEVESENASFYTIGLLTGPHAVKIIAEGYKPYNEEVQIEKGRKTALSIALNQ